MTPVLIDGPTRGDRLALRLAGMGLALIGLALAAVIATAWYPLPPLSRLAIRVVNAPVVNGELHIQVDYCKRYNVPPAEVRWALLDGVSIILPPYVMTLPEGCHVMTVSMPLNRSVAPGVYQLQVTGIYRLWPWRDVVYVERSAPFRIGEVAP